MGVDLAFVSNGYVYHKRHNVDFKSEKNIRLIYIVALVPIVRKDYWNCYCESQILFIRLVIALHITQGVMWRSLRH